MCTKVGTVIWCENWKMVSQNIKIDLLNDQLPSFTSGCMSTRKCLKEISVIYPHLEQQIITKRWKQPKCLLTDEMINKIRYCCRMACTTDSRSLAQAPPMRSQLTPPSLLHPGTSCRDLVLCCLLPWTKDKQEWTTNRQSQFSRQADRQAARGL